VINDAFGSTMKKLLAAAFAAASTLLLVSCGGGGATGNPTQGGLVTLLPNPGTAYAGIPFTVTIAGGRKPYALGSSEPSIFPVPAIQEENIFTVIPGQPGVVDVGLQPNEVPRRAVILTARDVNGNVASASLSVLQNFLLGYGSSLSSTCPSADPQSPVQACNGSETVITISPTFNGVLRGNALIRFERVRGSFGFVQCASPPPVDPTVVTTITTNTDHNGIARTCIRTANNSPTQIATFRIIDVATGVYVDELFVIVGGAAAGALTVLPQTLSFAGVNSLRCGTGSGDVLVFDGTLPYTAVSSNAAVSVTPSTQNTEPGRFSIQIGNQQPPCITDAAVVITDSQGRRATVTVTQTAGPPPPAITLTPATLTLACGQSGNVVVSGGTGAFTASSSSPNVTAAILGTNMTITRAPGPTPGANAQFTVTVTDGASVSTVSVTAPVTCN
jgi:hypothetical protein